MGLVKQAIADHYSGGNCSLQFIYMQSWQVGSKIRRSMLLATQSFKNLMEILQIFLKIFQRTHRKLFRDTQEFLENFFDDSYTRILQHWKEICRDSGDFVSPAVKSMLYIIMIQKDMDILLCKQRRREVFVTVLHSIPFYPLDFLGESSSLSFK